MGSEMCIRDSANSAAQNFMKSANSLIPIKYIPIPSGGHNIKVWKPFIASGFLWISGANNLQTPVIQPATTPTSTSASGSRK